jgi:hypothetical protein
MMARLRSKKMKTSIRSLAVVIVAFWTMAAASAAGPSYVDITWMSIANIYYELGSTGILTDGYITRIPLSNFYGGGGGLAKTRKASVPDAAAVTRVLTAIGGPSKVNLLLTGHSHFDHSFDTATWSKLTGAPIIGSKTTCFQAIAASIPADRCTPVYGGEKMTLADGVTVRIVRWNHSGDSRSNPEQHNPIELGAVPRLDAATGGLRAGVAEDFPNGGGGRGLLFTVAGPDGLYSWFYQNSASPSDLSVPIVIGGTNYGAPIENLKAAMNDAGLVSGSCSQRVRITFQPTFATMSAIRTRTRSWACSRPSFGSPELERPPASTSTAMVCSTDLT